MKSENLQETRTDTAQNGRTRSAAEDEISLYDIFSALKRQKRPIAICTGLAALVGFLYAIFSTPLYTAAITLGITAESGGALEGVGGQLGSIASLAGINLSGGGTEKDKYIAILKSRELGEHFIAEHSLMPHLFPDRWNVEAARWNEKRPGLASRVATGISKALATISGDEGWREPSPVPTLPQAYKKFEEIKSVSEDPLVGLITVNFRFRDPNLAAEWANAYVAMANEKIRKDVVIETTRAIDYLRSEAEKTTITGLRDRIYGLIENQLGKVMLANSRPQYAFHVLDKAVVPAESSHPKRGLIIILSVLLGGMIGVVSALMAEVWRGRLGRQNEGER